MSSYPELLFILLVMLLPLPIAFFLSSSLAGFLVRCLIGMATGFVIWLGFIYLIVWPKFHGPRRSG